LSSLKNKNNIRIFDQVSVENKGEMYLILEYIDGGNLQQLLDSLPEHKLCLTLSRKLFKNLLKGIIYLHNENVIHRDIKPENILLMRNGFIKIGDFGSAIRVFSQNEIESATFAHGSPCFSTT